MRQLRPTRILQAFLNILAAVKSVGLVDSVHRVPLTADLRGLDRDALLIFPEDGMIGLLVLDLLVT